MSAVPNRWKIAITLIKEQPSAHEKVQFTNPGFSIASIT